MIKNMIRFFAVALIALTGLAASAAAQDATRIKPVKIGFDFYAGKKHMPAGEYIVSLKDNFSSHKLIVVQQVGGDAQAILTSVPNDNKTRLEPGSLAFNKYGDQYFLAGVQLGGRNVLHTTLKTKGEREVSKSIARKDTVVRPDTGGQ